MFADLVVFVEKGNLSHFLGICLQCFEKNAPPFSPGWQRCRRKARQPNGGHQHTGSCAAFSCSPFLPSVLGVCICFPFSQRGHFDFLWGLRDWALEFSEQGQADGGKQLFGLSSNFFLSSSCDPSGIPNSWCIHSLCPHTALKKRKWRGVVWCFSLCLLWVANHPALK